MSTSTDPKTKDTALTWKIGGEAGFGIMSVGEMFARICMRAGQHVFSYPEYPSLIRGGHNTMQVTVGPRPVYAHRNSIHLLVALNRETIDRHLDEMVTGGTIIYDTTDPTLRRFRPVRLRRHDLRVVGLPFEDLAKSGGGQKLMRNTVALGASCALFGIPEDHLARTVTDQFTHKGAEVVRLNLSLVSVGFRAIGRAHRQRFPWTIRQLQHREPHILLSGNDALALGAIQAGCQFYSAYPMTPASSVLHFLAEHGPAHGMVVRHAEDEIAAINHAIGAAYTGVRAMTGSAGGGFALMTEAVGMAAMTEVGIVIIEAQRGGPSTGLPTWTEQADLRQVLHASQGDFPRIVFAPSTPAECFTLIQEAFNLADQYQTPAVIMTDKYLAEGLQSIPLSTLRRLPIRRGKIARPSRETKQFPRYRTNSTDGVAPRTLPGTPGGIFLANSDEHDQYGFSNEEAEMRDAQMARRARKEEHLRRHQPGPTVVGPRIAPLTVVTWGSSAGPVRAALDILRRRYGRIVNALIYTNIAPLNTRATHKLLSFARRTIMVEENQSGQFAGWIRQQTGRGVDHHYRRADGRPIDPEALAEELHQLLRRR